MRRISLAPLVLAALASGCAALGFDAVYPQRPPATPGEAIADPSPSRVVMHATIASASLKEQLESAIPSNGVGTFPFVHGERQFAWIRKPVDVRFSQGRVVVGLSIDAKADLPLYMMDLPLDVTIRAEPVVNASYVAKLQSTEVEVKTTGTVAKFADVVADIVPKVKAQIQAKLDDFSYDLKPLVAEANDRLTKPIDLPLGDAKGCAVVKVLGVEAGPTVLADGIEKDLAMVVQPSVLLPCPDKPDVAPLPPLENVATIQPGPFQVTIPVAARYDELAKAMGLTFTDGKLFFSKDYPELYLEKPEVYAAKDQLVLKLHIDGPIHKPVDTKLDGDLYMVGHPVVDDNELKVPDLEPTIDTSSFLLKLKQAFDGSAIRDQARAALHLDIGQRLAAAKDKLAKDLAFANGKGCLKAAAQKIEVSSVHVHQNYLRVYVTVTGTAALYMPCPPEPAAAPTPAAAGGAG
ncbi:MAG TPA: DUF4403 family protein [Minicystis sp.]|nr:DUF4403 family protein [Minicystis sp.]